MITANMKTVLIITYYWPPSGGPGVQRILKFTKYLPEFNWNPIILAPQTGEYPAMDHSLINEIPESCNVIKTPIFEPNNLYKIFTGMKRNEAIPIAVLTETNRLTFRKKISHWLRANLFIPDAKIGWLPFAVSKGKQIIKQHQIDLIFSSSPPPTTHLIAKKLAAYAGIKWVADFRDPWTDTRYYHYVPRLKIVQNYDNKLERSVLNSADWNTCFSKTYIDNFKKTVNHNRFSFIPNGYDAADLEDINFDIYPSKFRISSIGTLNNERNPVSLFKAVKNMLADEEDFKKHIEIELVGIIAASVNEEIEKHRLQKYVKKTNYLPHIEALKRMADSCLLLLPLNNVQDKGILTGKIFEYIGSGKTILGFGDPAGEAASIVREIDAGHFFKYNDVKGTEIFLKNQYQLWKNGKLRRKKNDSFIAKYDRKQITQNLAEIFLKCD